MDEILIGYWVVGHVRTMSISVMYLSKFRMGGITLRSFLMITCDMFLRDRLRNTGSIALLESGRVRVDGIGDAL